MPPREAHIDPQLSRRISTSFPALIAAERRPPPVLGRLRGALKDGSVRDYHRYLERKYR